MKTFKSLKSLKSLKKSLRSQSGFSLIELMVVVAIIGILATMSVGAVSKQIAKSRQSEAKTNLSSLFTSMKAFQAEYSQYTSDFVAIGAGFEGNMRYQTGFGSYFAPPAVPAYTGARAPTMFTTAAYCAGAGATCAVIASNGTVPMAATGTPTAISFIATANAFIYKSALNDRWQITETKAVSNPSPGIN